MKEIKKEDKFFVIKKEKIDEYFSQYTKGKFTTAEEQATIEQIPFFEVINDPMINNGKKYIVCNQDEPYADAVWSVILEGETAKMNNQNME